MTFNPLQVYNGNLEFDSQKIVEARCRNSLTSLVLRTIVDIATRTRRAPAHTVDDTSFPPPTTRQSNSLILYPVRYGNYNCIQLYCAQMHVPQDAWVSAFDHNTSLFN